MEDVVTPVNGDIINIYIGGDTAGDTAGDSNATFAVSNTTTPLTTSHDDAFALATPKLTKITGDTLTKWEATYKTFQQSMENFLDVINDASIISHPNKKDYRDAVVEALHYTYIASVPAMRIHMDNKRSHIFKANIDRFNEWNAWIARYTDVAACTNPRDRMIYAIMEAAQSERHLEVYREMLRSAERHQKRALHNDHQYDYENWCDTRTLQNHVSDWLAHLKADRKSIMEAITVVVTAARSDATKYDRSRLRKRKQEQTN